MVAFKNPIVSFLVIPSGATSGERVTIDGTTGVITVYGPTSTGPGNGVVAQIGNGVGLTLELPPIELSILQESGPAPDWPGFRWTNINNGEFGYQNAFLDTNGVVQLGMQTSPFNVGGSSVRMLLELSSSTAFLGYESALTNVRGLSGINVFPNDVVLFATNTFGTPAAVCHISNNTAFLGTADTTTGNAYIQVNENGSHTMYFNLDNLVSPPTYLAVQKGAQVTGQPVIVAPNDNWLTLTLANGFTTPSNVNTYFNGLRIRKDAAGTVFLQGSVQAPASGAFGVSMAGIPGGFTPSARQLFICLYSGNTTKLADLFVGSPTDAVHPGGLFLGTDLGSTSGGELFVSCQWPGEW